MGAESTFKRYLDALTEVARRGDAREESYYGTLSDLLEELAQVTEREHVHVTTLPQPTEAGNPDFRLWNGSDRIIGYIEAKLPGDNLDRVENSDQLRRYRETFPNLILTDFLEFRLYRDGELVDKALLGRPFVLKRIGTAPPLEEADELAALLDRFLGFSLPRSYTAEELARTKRLGFRYQEEEERVYINPSQYFGPVPLDVWEYQIGGYQVCHKWLKDRRERELSLEEVKTYCRIVTALQRTMTLQAEIDDLYPQVEETLLE